MINLKPSPFAPKTFPVLPEIAGIDACTHRLGLYPGNRTELLVMRFAKGTAAAGVFTRSHTRSDDVDWCRQALTEGKGQARALVVNAGNSNAFTGAAGIKKNQTSLDHISALTGAPRSEHFIAATGVIGEPLAIDLVAKGIDAAWPALSAVDWQACSRTIMTTDTYPKGAGAKLELDGFKINIAGIAKGSGMIAPNMATMLAYIFTDADIAPQLLQTIIRRAADKSFNAITIDSDSSTSDSFMAFATGETEAPQIKDERDPRFDIFYKAFEQVSMSLAHQIVKDGEGATKFIGVQVHGAETDRAAKQIATSVANSPLVKTALAASDPNWGRIVMAIGKTDEKVDRDAVSIMINGVMIARNGARAPDYNESDGARAVGASEIDIQISVGQGEGHAHVWTCDLTHTYIDINGAYRT